MPQGRCADNKWADSNGNCPRGQLSYMTKNQANCCRKKTLTSWHTVFGETIQRLKAQAGGRKLTRDDISAALRKVSRSEGRPASPRKPLCLTKNPLPVRGRCPPGFGGPRTLLSGKKCCYSPRRTTRSPKRRSPKAKSPKARKTYGGNGNGGGEYAPLLG